jgi:hypothetical protein
VQLSKKTAMLFFLSFSFAKINTTTRQSLPRPYLLFEIVISIDCCDDIFDQLARETQLHSLAGRKSRAHFPQLRPCRAPAERRQSLLKRDAF